MRNRANAGLDDDEKGGGDEGGGGDNNSDAEDADHGQAECGSDTAVVENLKEQLSRVDDLLAQLVKARK